ncbi:hypothetical protein NBH00_20905 [Paraconexibacter antarcticus]|uniref:Uncharacterized protein n=1 Tax=Paraconexibacter antarcticus TaxID=2949664 RepID=A0ABY5DQ48_9ACTN|nr:hypothetical protein [Paraconexibacter antarcticus]UTI63791.1 hypothetical protein NBH00_20905 [Paraconexibacter antarcticus]
MRPPHPRARLKPVPLSADEAGAEARAEATFLALALRGALDGEPTPPYPPRGRSGETVAEFLRRVTTSAAN